MIAKESLLGIGLYAPAEAARYVRASSQRFNRWVFGTSSSKPVFTPELGTLDDDRRVVTFLDFAQALSIQDIRLNVNIPLKMIREAYREAQERHGITYPFAAEHGIFVYGNLTNPAKCCLAIFHGNKREQGDLVESYKKRAVQLTGKAKGNLLIHQVVQEFSKRLRFSSDTGIASRYTCFESKDHRIVMDPDVHFGKPYFEDIGYKAVTLSDSARIEGGIEAAADRFRVPISAVKAAVLYMRELDTEPKKLKPTLRDEHKS